MTSANVVSWEQVKRRNWDQNRQGMMEGEKNILEDSYNIFGILENSQAMGFQDKSWRGDL